MILVIMGVLGCLSFPVTCPGAEDLPSVSEVTRRMIDRARSVAREDRGPQYAYEKRSLLEHLNAKGHNIESEERVHQVTLIAGFPFTRLVRIRGRELTSEELAREQRREERFRQRFTSVDATNMVAKKEAWVTPQLLDRYQFVVKERVKLNDRPTLVLLFSPKGGKLPEQAVQDKLLNRMAGTIWIDEQEAEVARLSVNLTESVSLGWFGVLGSLSRCELSLERQRMPESVWVNARQVLRIQCRKLASTMHLRITEASSGFKQVGPSRSNALDGRSIR